MILWMARIFLNCAEASIVYSEHSFCFTHPLETFSQIHELVELMMWNRNKNRRFRFDSTEQDLIECVVDSSKTVHLLECKLKCCPNVDFGFGVAFVKYRVPSSFRETFATPMTHKRSSGKWHKMDQTSDNIQIPHSHSSLKLLHNHCKQCLRKFVIDGYVVVWLFLLPPKYGLRIFASLRHRKLVNTHYIYILSKSE